MGRLKKSVKDALGIMVRDVSRQVEEHAGHTASMLEQTAGQFIDELLEDNRKETETKTQLLENREESLSQYNNLRELINRQLDDLSGLVK